MCLVSWFKDSKEISLYQLGKNNLSYLANKYNCVCCILCTCMKISNLFLPTCTCIYFGFASLSLGIWVKYVIRSLLIVKGDYIGGGLSDETAKTEVPATAGVAR